LANSNDIPTTLTVHTLSNLWLRVFSPFSFLLRGGLDGVGVGVDRGVGAGAGMMKTTPTQAIPDDEAGGKNHK